MENTVRVFYVVALKDKESGKVHIDTELVDSTSVERATEYLKNSFGEEDSYELCDFRISKMSAPSQAIVWLKK